MEQKGHRKNREDKGDKVKHILIIEVEVDSDGLQNNHVRISGNAINLAGAIAGSYMTDKNFRLLLNLATEMLEKKDVKIVDKEDSN